jgi:NADPH2:quinone reductase
VTRAIRIERVGGPELLAWEEVDTGEPDEGQVRIRHAAIGINYIDIYHRSGVYPLPMPAVLGLEAAGTVITVGPGVTRVRPGDRVAYAGGPPGAYAEERVMGEDRLIVLPSGVDAEQAASMMFSGLTAQFLLRQVYPVKAGDVVLIHAAAGKVGLLLCQWAKHLGATVIGTVGNDAKAELVEQNGCDFPIIYTREKVSERVARITDAAKVNVVYDSVGRDTFADSLDSLRPKGMLVSFGVASGETPPLDLRLLLSKGSLFVTRPSFGHYMGEAESYRAAASELLALVQAGALKIITNHRFPLRNAATAHRTMEGRQTTGACLLIP